MLLQFLKSLHLSPADQKRVKAVEGFLWVAVSAGIMAGAHFIVGNGLISWQDILKVMGGAFVAALINGFYQLEGQLVLPDVPPAPALPQVPAAPAAPKGGANG